MTLEIRDISQAYVQSKSTLAREFLMYLPKELKDRYPEGTILHVMKLLYGIAEACHECICMQKNRDLLAAIDEDSKLRKEKEKRRRKERRNYC